MSQYFSFQWHITDECDQRCKHCSFLKSFYLSDAPHAAGFSSGLPAAPHAAPHAALVSVSAFFFHPKRFDNAILLPPDILFVVIFVTRL